MDDFRSVIMNNITRLCDITCCSQRLLDRCVEEHIMTRDQVAIIASEVLPYMKNRKFYETVEFMGDEDIKTLIKIMREDNTRQPTDLVKTLSSNFHRPNQNRIIPRLPGINSAISFLKKSIWFEVPAKDDSFFGREAELRKLHAFIMRNSGLEDADLSIYSQITSISGLGGIGKTSLAIQYAWSYAETFDGNVIWIDAETRSSMQDAFRDLALEVGTIIEQSQNEPLSAKSIQKIYNSIVARKCLIVFDNVNHFYRGVDAFLPKYLPRNSSNAHTYGVIYRTPFVLMTSRKRNLMQRIKPFELGLMKDTEAHELILKELGREYEGQNEGLVHQLAFTLQYLPLALKQAIAYIRNLQEKAQILGKTEDPIQTYLRLFKQKTAELLGFEHYRETADIYKRTVLVTWKVTMDQIQDEGGQISQHIMNIMGYFHPRRIEISTFDKMFSETEAGDAILLLRQYSMIDIEDSKILIHRLVQMVIREISMDASSDLYQMLKKMDNFRAYDEDEENADTDGQQSPARAFLSSLRHEQNNFTRPEE